MNKEPIPTIFTPDNEPYLGRTLLFHFDQTISSVMELNSKLAPKSHKMELTDHQKMACIIIPQAISIMLSIRELIRQSYLFGAKVLSRAFVERAAILLYLYHYPKEIKRWNKGWNYRDAPTLSTMLEEINKKTMNMPIKGYELTAAMNSLLHAKPDSAFINLIDIGEDKAGYAPSKILNNPKLCDDICADLIPWIAIVLAMMTFYFEKS